MSGTVSRQKYENIKRKAEQWRKKALEAFDEIQELREELDNCDQNDTGIDPDAHNNIIAERDDLLEEVNSMRQKMKDEVFKQERELIRKNGEIDRLKMSLTDYKERYQEIREDNKELRRASRGVS